jgi:hypothetical protein
MEVGIGPWLAQNRLQKLGLYGNQIDDLGAGLLAVMLQRNIR